jgi:hypothetical protein
MEVVVSTGQYGHLNRTVRLPRASLCSEADARTWPHGNIMGGLSGVAGSLETGHEKMEWCTRLRPGSCGGRESGGGTRKAGCV